MTFGEKLRLLRKSRGITVQGLALRLKVDKSYISVLENSKSKPSDKIIAGISRIFGVDKNELALMAGRLPKGMGALLSRNSGTAITLIKEEMGIYKAKPITRPRKNLKPILGTPLGSLFNADCLDLLRTLDAESVDCIFADPPFNLGKVYGNKVNDRKEKYEYIGWCYAWLEECCRVLKPGGSLFVYNLPKWNILIASFLDKLLTFRHWITVDIKFSLPIPKRLYPSHYSLLYFVKGALPKTFHPPRRPMETCRHCGGEIKDYGGYKDKMNPNGINLTDVWIDIPPVRHAKFKTREANQLSVKLLDRVIDIATDEGDTVLDPFGGSGTTFIVAELKGRRWIGSEVEDCEPILQRFKCLDEQRQILEESRKDLNRLFSSESLKLRRKFGHSTSKYRTLEEPLFPTDVQTSFEELLGSH